MAEKYVPLNARTSQVALVAKSLSSSAGDLSGCNIFYPEGYFVYPLGFPSF